MDVFPRKVLAWQISITLKADFCDGALIESIRKFDPPAIKNMEHSRTIGSNGNATSGQPVDVIRLARPPEPGRHPVLDGWQRPLPRQHLCRSLKRECADLHAQKT